MMYLGNPCSPAIRRDMEAGRLGCMVTPGQGNVVPDGAWWAADNGRFGNGWRGAGEWSRWLARQVERYGTARCLFAVAPDVPFDAAGTLAESWPWLRWIAGMGIPAAFAAQDGCDEPGLMPWGEFGVLFLAGSTEWKLGPVAERMARKAASRGIPVHMGRVNGRGRLRNAEWFGCRTADGTTFTRGPDTNHADMMRWLAELDCQPSLYGVEGALSLHLAASA